MGCVWVSVLRTCLTPHASTLFSCKRWAHLACTGLTSPPKGSWFCCVDCKNLKFAGAKRKRPRARQPVGVLVDLPPAPVNREQYHPLEVLQAREQYHPLEVLQARGSPKTWKRYRKYKKHMRLCKAHSKEDRAAARSAGRELAAFLAAAIEAANGLVAASARVDGAFF